MAPYFPKYLDYLDRCCQLARLPGAAVEPNPRVGAVLVHGSRIIGEGWHQQYGGPHAEVNAIAAVSPADQHLIAASILHVSLEPCNHHGKTPPCTDLILRHGIRHVVVGSLDPYPRMQGLSVARLRVQGVKVEVVDYPPCLALNRHFWTNQSLRRPHVTLKWAESADGFIAAHDASGQPIRTAITGPEAARWVHQLRHEHHAILIGAGTALIDDPALTTRHWPGRDPIGVLLDRQLRVPRTAQLFGLPRVLVWNEVREGRDGHVYYVQDPIDDLAILLARLGQAGYGSILVEGGAEVLSAFLAEGLWDDAFVLRAPRTLGAGLAAPASPHMNASARGKLGLDEWVYFENTR